MKPLREVDHGWDRLVAGLKSIQRNESYAKAGVLGDAKARKDGDPASTVDVAFFNEFGVPSKGIPERSFVRASFDAHRTDYLGQLRQLAGGVYANTITVDRALGIMGLKMAADMKARIVAFVPPPNAPSTLARKEAKTTPGSTGAPKPLIDTGQLLNSISHAVVLR